MVPARAWGSKPPGSAIIKLVMDQTQLITRHTESGDLYTATGEDWAKYRAAVAADDWDTVMFFETGGGSFKYTPDE